MSRHCHVLTRRGGWQGWLCVHASPPTCPAPQARFSSPEKMYTVLAQRAWLADRIRALLCHADGGKCCTVPSCPHIWDCLAAVSSSHICNCLSVVLSFPICNCLSSAPGRPNILTAAGRGVRSVCAAPAARLCRRCARLHVPDISADIVAMLLTPQAPPTRSPTSTTPPGPTTAFLRCVRHVHPPLSPPKIK